MQSYFWRPAGGFLRFLDFSGSEPPLAFVHGLGASGAQAFGNVSRLPPLRDRRCVVPDLLGFGHSDRPDAFSYSIDDHAASLAALLDAQGLREVTVLGHSMGGAVAIALASTRPDLVARLVLAEAHLNPTPGAVSGPILAYSETDFARGGHADLVRLLVSQGFETYAGAFQAASPIAVHRTAASLLAPRSPTLREMLLALPMPRVSLFGSKSLTDPDTQWLPEHGIPVRIISGAGHDMMTDRPDAFAAAVGVALS